MLPFFLKKFYECGDVPNRARGLIMDRRLIMGRRLIIARIDISIMVYIYVTFYRDSRFLFVIRLLGR